jgi:hypothetical protein
MKQEQKICVFSLSEKDPAFGHKDIERAKNWLINKGEKPYYFRESKPKELSPGSIALFSFDAHIFGQACVKKAPAAVSSEEQENWRKTGNIVYKYYMILNGSSIEIFRFYPAKRDIEERLDLRFAQLFTYLNFNQYNEILKMARR